MAELLIAEDAAEDYVQSLRWYAERSNRAAEGLEAEFAQALQASLPTLSATPCVTTAIASTD